jgi:GNAT superfamily N-acetyltransferase
MTAAAAERCLAEAWPAPETVHVGGWRVRLGKGGYGRVNSVWAVAPPDKALDAAIAEVEAIYRRQRLPARFLISAGSVPAGLGTALAERGYAVETPCAIMAKAVVSQAVPSAVRLSATAGEDWISIYRQSLTPERAAELPLILPRIPRPHVFAVAHVDGQPAAVAIGAKIGDDVAIDSVFTMADFRRRGAAEALMAGLESWAAGEGANRLVLAVVDDNTPAVALYEKLGFRPLTQYHYRVKA